MNTLNIPTKRNLLLARQRLALARKGYDLLDKKRHVLINELASVQYQMRQALDDLCDSMHVALSALAVAQAEMGRDKVQDVSKHMPCKAAVSISFRSIMGIEVPVATVSCVKKYDLVVPYALSETTASLDEAVLAWNKVRELIVTWTSIENTMHRLNLHIKKTQKRANALGNITIPMYEARIKYIQERLEERERDELARLKKVKRRLT